MPKPQASRLAATVAACSAPCPDVGDVPREQRPARPSSPASAPRAGSLVRDRYDDGGFSGGTLERPALRRLLADVERGLVDVVVVYKIDRLSRSLTDFAKLVDASRRTA
jgi:hypothetical protein